MSNIEHIRLLLVEDDDEDADIFHRYIDHVRHHSVVTVRAREADEARLLLGESQFDLIFLDLNVRGHCWGLELLKEIQAKDTAPPVIMVTGSGDEEKAAESMRLGAADYLIKDRLSSELLDRTIRTARENYALQRQRKRMMARLAELSVTDELTSVANRRHLMVKLQEELIRSNRTGHLFAFLLLDLDHFKEVNDHHGHQAGDKVLRDCAGAIARNLRSTDFIARYGGDEFCILIPNTSLLGAEKAAEKVGETVELLPDPIPTVSIGVAFWHPGVSQDGMLRQADQALYEAKQKGGNQVIVRERSPVKQMGIEDIGDL